MIPLSCACSWGYYGSELLILRGHHGSLFTATPLSIVAMLRAVSLFDLLERAAINDISISLWYSLLIFISIDSLVSQI